MTYIEPSQSTPRLPERTLVLSSSAQLQPKHAPEPILDRVNSPKIILLVMQVGRNVVAEQRKEAADSERLIEPFQDIVVDRVVVEDVAEEGHDAVHWDKEEDSNDVFLFVGFEIMRRMGEDEKEADACCDQRKNAGQEEAEVVEGEALP